MVKFICKKPGKKSIAILKRDEKVISPSYAREYSFVFKKGKGSYVYDVDNRKYLDFAAGIAVNNIGHANPEVIKAIKKQIPLGLHAAFGDFYAELPVIFTENLLKFVPKNFQKVFLSNSGTESIEAAYKLARWHTKKKYVIAFANCFHGRTMGSLSMTNSKPVQRERFSPFLPVKHIPYPYVYRMPFKNEADCTNYCINKIEKTIRYVKGNVAAIFMEPIQGEGGYIVPPKNFPKEIRKICNDHNILFCDDEVQAGCYRTGKFLAIENFNTLPDIISLSKAIGGGIPLGATLASQKVMNWSPGSHSNTFGGNLVACTAGIATLDYMKKHNLGENAAKIGKYILKRLDEIKEKYEIIGDVRGLGLMIGVELVKNKRTKEHAIKERSSILCKAQEKGLILLPAGVSTIRICPPLIITKKEAEQGLNILEDSLNKR